MHLAPEKLGSMAMSASDNGVRRDPLLPELPGHCSAIIAVIGPAVANGNGVWIAQIWSHQRARSMKFWCTCSGVKGPAIKSSARWALSKIHPEATHQSGSIA
jgi:hypothetical protein